MPHKDPEVRRKFERERHRRRTAERREMGLCPKCGRRNPAPGRSLCVACLERSRAAERARYERARLEGAAYCPKCGRRNPAPGRSLCVACLERSRAAERARYERARLEGAAYGGRDPESRRRMARERNRRRRRERREAGLCALCGRQAPAEESAVCAPCREERRAAERKIYAERRAGGLCGRCGAEVIDNASTCASCAARDAKRRPRKNAASRARYHRRRASRLCVDCGAHADAGVRCASCARRSYLSSGEHKGMPVYPPRFTVVELATGVEHGPLDSWEEMVWTPPRQPSVAALAA